ncbi:MAG: TetR/AcrR family transcriptional regulator [Xanthomonadaceae bacterium]|nr:TetR/AcrR family transcriptional regulator [Xanthomonadaceae bacterium]
MDDLTPLPDAATPATRDPDLTRGRILDAAFELFVEKGFAGVAMREIAERSGVTKSLIHHHFGSKEALWDATKEQAFSQYAESQRTELKQNPRSDEALLRNSVIDYFNFLKNNPRVVRLFAWTHLEGDASCGEMDAELVALGAERIRQAQQAGIFRRDINPVHVVTTFVMACTHWFEARSHHAQWPGIGNDDEFLDDFLKLFMAGLAPSADASPA